MEPYPPGDRLITSPALAVTGPARAHEPPVSRGGALWCRQQAQRERRNAAQVPPYGEPGPPRYWLLETLRHYGRQRLRELGEQTATQQRHFDWICALAEKAGACDATQARAFKRMSGEIFVPNGPVITVTRAPRVPESLTSCCARTMSGAVQTPAEFGLSV